MRLLRKRFIIGIPTIAAAAGVGAFVWATHDDASVQYRTSAATLGTVTQTVSLSGNLSPVAETDLNFGSSGKVTAVDVQAGQQVSAGQVLATLDATQLQDSLSIAQANLSSAQAKLSLDQAGPTAQNLASAEAQVSNARTTLQNSETAYNDTVAVNQQAVTQAQDAYQAAQSQYTNDGCPSSPKPGANCTQDQSVESQDYNAWQAAITKGQQSDDQAQGQVAVARVQLQSAQAALSALEQGSTPQQIQMDQSQVQIDQVNVNSAQTALNQASITAPTGGVVSAINIAVGDVVGSSGGGSSGSSGSSSASGSSGSGSGSGSSSSTPAISIITPGSFEVTGTVSDALVDEIAVGQKAQVTVAGSSEAQTGTVTDIAPQATISSGVATFPVTVTLDGTDPSLRDGMSASVNVIVNQVVGVLTVPTSAVHTSSAGSTVQVLVNGRAQTLVVQVGASDALRTQIVSGLNAGDQVIVATVSANVPSNTGAGGLFGGFGGRGGGGGGGGGAGGRATSVAPGG